MHSESLNRLERLFNRLDRELALASAMCAMLGHNAPYVSAPLELVTPDNFGHCISLRLTSTLKAAGRVELEVVCTSMSPRLSEWAITLVAAYFMGKHDSVYTHETGALRVTTTLPLEEEAASDIDEMFRRVGSDLLQEFKLSGSPSEWSTEKHDYVYGEDCLVQLTRGANSPLTLSLTVPFLALAVEGTIDFPGLIGHFRPAAARFLDDNTLALVF